jgi:hypothetical protein
MPKIRKSISNNELIKLSEKVWANVDDIMNIGSVGKNKAREIFREIKKDYKCNISSSFVPMTMAFEYFHIDLYNGGITNVSI